jgi:hypothetical protein
MIVLLGIIFGIFASGFIFGYAMRYSDEQFIARRVEKETYCNGYEDGFYLGWGEYEPEAFRREIAEKAYNEYKGLKYGPERH